METETSAAEPRPPPCVGFISPPGWFDPTPGEFPTVCAEPVRVQQCPLSLPGFDWRIDSIARTEPEMLSAARTLGEMGCTVVAKVGTPFAWAGLPSAVAARARLDRLALAAKVPAVMSGVAILDALDALAARRVILCCTYYSDDWTERWARLVRTTGIEVVADNLSRQGLTASHDAADSEHWAPPPDQIIESVRRCVSTAPDADAIAVSGAGARTLALIHALEAETGRPVFGSDTALYWATARAAGIRLKSGILGRLTDA